LVFNSYKNSIKTHYSINYETIACKSGGDPIFSLERPYSLSGFRKSLESPAPWNPQNGSPVPNIGDPALLIKS